MFRGYLLNFRGNLVATGVFEFRALVLKDPKGQQSTLLRKQARQSGFGRTLETKPCAKKNEKLTKHNSCPVNHPVDP